MNSIIEGDTEAAMQISQKKRPPMMKSLLSIAAIIAANAANADEQVPSWLFVHTASSFVVDEAKVSVPFEREIFGFTDRPDRLHAYLNAHEFVSLWNENEGAFGEVPPNAVLTWIADGAIEEAEIILLGAEASDTGRMITYEFAFLAGSQIPKHADYSSLFVDSFTGNRTVNLGSRLIDRQSQNMTVAARATADRKVFAHRS